jgi:hypothetical protein
LQKSADLSFLTMESMNPAWSLTFQEARWYRWHLAGAGIFVCRSGNCWQGFCTQLPWDERSGGCSGPVQEEPEGTALPGKVIMDGETAALRPCLPEKPFVVNLSGLRLFPGEEISLEFRLPPKFRLIAEENGDQGEQEEILFNFAPFMLKETWYSHDTMKGVIGVSLSAIVPDTDNSGDASGSLEFLPGIGCTMQIRNRAKTTVDLDKVPLYTDILAVYENNGKFICDGLVIDEYGKDFHLSVKPAQGTLLTPACKSGMGDTLIHWGTRIIRNITGL